MNSVDQRATIRRSIAVIGVGQIGSTFAYKLARAGHDVTVIARPGSLRLNQLRRDNGIVLKTGDRAEMRVGDELDEQTAYDLVVVTTLAHQAESLLPALARSKAQCIHFMSVNFNPERFQDAIGKKRCTFGMPFVMASLDREGKLNSRIGSRPKTLHGDQRWVDLFNGGGVPSAFEPDMLLWLRCHAPLTVAMESISVAGQRRGAGASWTEAMVVARGLRGGFAIVKRLGYRLYPRPKSVIASFPTFVIACTLWLVSRIASFRELLATGLSESRALADSIVAAAAKAKPALPAAVQAVLAMKPSEERGNSAVIIG